MQFWQRFRDNRTILGITLFFWIGISYAIPNHFQFFTPRIVPLTIVDDWVPLRPLWTWIYVSYYLFLLGIYALLPSAEARIEYAKVMASTALCGALFFVALPTRIPREVYIALDSGPSGWLMSVLRTADNSTNCLPSMHVALATITAVFGVRYFRRHSAPIVIWTLLIFYSTMATKQHYFLDVVSGTLVALALLRLFYATAVPRSSADTVSHSGLR